MHPVWGVKGTCKGRYSGIVVIIQVGSPRQSQFTEESFVVVFAIRDVRILYKETIVGISHQLFQRCQLTGRRFKIVVVWLLWLVGTRFGIQIQFSVFDSLLVEDFVVKNIRPVVFKSHKGFLQYNRKDQLGTPWHNHQIMFCHCTK